MKPDVKCCREKKKNSAMFETYNNYRYNTYNNYIMIFVL